MHIGIDARLWNETGVGRYIRNLVKNLQKIDKENQYTLFVLSKDREKIKSQITNPKFQMVTADIRWHSVAEQRNFPGVIRSEKPDLMHFPYFSVPLFYNGPFVVTIHDLILHHFATGEATTLPYPLYRAKLQGYRYIVKHAAQMAKKVITVSEATKIEIIDHLKVHGDKVIVTYEGYERSHDSGIKNHESSIKGRYFLHVGNVYPHKNAVRLLEAFRIFINNRSQNDAVRLVLVGKEDYFFQRLKHKVTDLGLSKHIRFVGEVSDNELNLLYKHAAATVVPSLMEGFGLPAVEAIANKCLVICSDIPSLREVCGDAALYCDPYNTESIADCLEQSITLSDDEKVKKIATGLAKIQKYSWEKMARETLEVYESSTGLR